MRRLTLVTVFAALWLVAAAPAASADPPGPTDYESQVIDIEPAVGGFDVEIIGGDSFVLLRATPGTTVEVIGYQGEPYLRFLPDGTVEENAASPSRFLNEDRYAAAELPPIADATAPPDWQTVGDGGSYAWHDHRTHWMNPVAPPGRGPGDQVAEGVVPLLVEGVEVDVTVVSIWQPAPSSFAVLAGVIAGLVIGLTVVGRRRWLAAATLALSVAAFLAGIAAYGSVPPETVPSWSLVLFPSMSLLSSLIVVFPGLLGPGADVVRRQSPMLIVLAGLELVAWAILHWDWLWRAILPTSVPFWLDRFVAAMVLVGGLGMVAIALLAVTRRTVVAEPS